MPNKPITPAFLKALKHIRSGQVFRDVGKEKPYSCWYGVGPASIMKAVECGYATYADKLVSQDRCQAQLTDEGQRALEAEELNTEAGDGD